MYHIYKLWYTLTIAASYITSFFLDGTEINRTFTNTGAGYFEFTEEITLANNGDLLLVIYTDTAGNQQTVNEILTVIGPGVTDFTATCLSEITVPLDSTCTYI